MAKHHWWKPRLLALLGSMAFITPAFAQLAAAPTVPQPIARPDNATALTEASARVQAVPPAKTGPTFWLFGIPIRPSAPVPPPYEGTAYNDLGGQPMTGVDQVMSQQFTDQQR